MMGAVRVSLLMANYNGARYIEDAIGSALAQSLREVEVIVVDDCSTDDSLDRARRIAAMDPRVIVERLAHNGGPGAARNRALELARGEWIAILDSDDLMHPRRLERLIQAAEASGADMIADDLMLFDQDGAQPPRSFLARRDDRPYWLDLAAYLNAGVLLGKAPNPGFLKPVIRRAPIVDQHIRYDPALRIAEDDYFIIRLLAAGMKYRIVPTLGYFYRKHSSSISHRLERDHITAMAHASGHARQWVATFTAAIERGFSRREAGFRRALAFTDVVTALKARRPLAALLLAARHPTMLPLTRDLVKGAIAKRRRRKAPAPAPLVPQLTIVSRQRLVGATNGSSSYLLEVAAAARRAGYVPHLMQPSPTLLGRMPFFRLRPEMRVFETHAIRGVVRRGNWVIARSPAVWLAAVLGVSKRLLARAGLRWDWLKERPAPYAISMPWTREDALFVASKARGTSDVLVADYMFQAEGLPFALRPDARTAIVMHDLFHARTGGAADSVAAVSRDDEVALLAQADAVIAIQATEADFVRAHVPGPEVILMPSGARLAPGPQPGSGQRLLFVGSNTAPNVEGLRWFFAQVWPQVRAAVPDARLDVAGTVAASLSTPPDGVNLLGLVDDLAPLYRDAAVLISPLTFGSGLKIKLVEALAAGKAIVATSITLQGVEEIVGESVEVADDPDRFAAATVRLMTSDSDREALATRAFFLAAKNFTPEVTGAGLVAWLQAKPLLHRSTARFGHPDEDATTNGEQLVRSANAS